MSSQRDDDDDTRPVVWAVLIGAIVLAVGLALGFGIAKSMKGVASGGSASAAASSSANGAAASASDAAGSAGAAAGATGNTQAAGAQGAANAQGLQLRDDESRVVVEGGVVKFYFASGKADLATGAEGALAGVAKAVADGKRAIVSGYTDATGDMVKNAELAKVRAQAVRDTLVALGIGDDKLELRKPDATTATGSNAEARRVEVTLE